MNSGQDTSPDSEVRFWAKTVSGILASIDSIHGKLGAAFPSLRSWRDRPVILPHAQQPWWHMGRTGYDKPSMQIVTYWYVTNRTDKPVNILNAYIKRPRLQGMVMTNDTRSAYHGSYAVPPRATTDLHASFDCAPPFRKEGKTITIDIVFVDQNGQRRTVRNVAIKSDKTRSPVPVKLEEESLYKLEHEVEKKVAAVLKDEISRYKKFGRISGELGSLHAIYNGRQVKQIYQDGWASSSSGERLEIVSDPENSVVRSENGDALVLFYKSLEEDADKELFTNSLLTRLNRSKEYYCVSYIILYVLFRIRRLEVGVAAANTALRLHPTRLDKLLRKKPREALLEAHQRHGFGDMFGLFNGLLRYEHSSFSDHELDLIEGFVEGGEEFSATILEKINSARSFRLNK